MELLIIHIVIALVLLDSVTFLIISFCGRRWYLETFAPITRWFPPAKGWAIYYFILTLIIAWLGLMVAS